MSPSGRYRDSANEARSPLSNLPAQNYILGYFQNNPDGSFQTPLTQPGKTIPADRKNAVAQLERANRLFNRIRTAATDEIAVAPPKVVAQPEQKQQGVFARKYLDLTRSQEPKAHLGQKQKRLEKVTVAQAENVARQEKSGDMRSPAPAVTSYAKSRSPQRRAGEELRLDTDKGEAAKMSVRSEPGLKEDEIDIPDEAASETRAEDSFQVEVAPLQSVFCRP